MANLTLYMLDGSPPCWAVMMLGEMLDLKFEHKKIDFVMEHKSPEFLKKNPMGTIPVLEDGDFIISESHTIMKYLLEKYGGSHRDQLYPKELKAQALVDQANYFDTGVVFIRIKNIALPAVFEGATHIPPKVIEETETCYGIINMYLERGAFVAGNQMTLADLSLGCSVTALHGFHKVDAKKYPLTADWLSRLHKLPYFKNVAIPGSETLTAFVTGAMQKNSQ